MAFLLSIFFDGLFSSSSEDPLSCEVLVLVDSELLMSFDDFLMRNDLGIVGTDLELLVVIKYNTSLALK